MHGFLQITLWPSCWQSKHFTDEAISPDPVKKVFYWNSAILICLDASSGCFHILVAELNSAESVNTVCPQRLKYFLSGPLQRPLTNPYQERQGHAFLPCGYIGLSCFQDLSAVTDSLVCLLLIHKNLPSGELRMLVLPHSNPVPLCPLHNGTSRCFPSLIHPCPESFGKDLLSINCTMVNKIDAQWYRQASLTAPSLCNIREMAQSVKCVPSKHEDLNSIPSTHIQSQACWHMPIIPELSR